MRVPYLKPADDGLENNDRVNATLNDNVRIAENCLIGASSHITKDTEAERIYIGVPARAVPGKSSFDAGI